ncbi:MAG: FAD-dependent oxidoreductase [Alphaproteobacteria bacterium]
MPGLPVWQPRPNSASERCLCLYEASDKIGGALNMIPDERLPYEVIAKDWSFIFNRDFITLYLTTKIGSPSDLFSQGFDGVIVATGEPNVTDLGIPGQEYAVSYMEYLHHPSKYETKGRVAVIGGGNVAADCAFTAAANGAAQVEMFVRRRLADMRISQLEYLELLKREIDIMSMSSPEKIEKTADGYSLYIRKNRLTDGHWQQLANSTVELPGFSLIVTAIGSRADPKVNDERIIYAGDCKHGGSTIVEALASGRDAARLMESRLVMAAE